jgi:hypothetical protein
MIEICDCKGTRPDNKNGWYSVQVYYDGYNQYCWHCGKILEKEKSK